jgi:hypothetical protein
MVLIAPNLGLSFFLQSKTYTPHSLPLCVSSLRLKLTINFRNRHQHRELLLPKRILRLPLQPCSALDLLNGNHYLWDRNSDSLPPPTVPDRTLAVHARNLLRRSRPLWRCSLGPCPRPPAHGRDSLARDAARSLHGCRVPQWSHPVRTAHSRAMVPWQVRSMVP